LSINAPKPAHEGAAFAAAEFHETKVVSGTRGNI
jgi:hypothetical protein